MVSTPLTLLFGALLAAVLLEFATLQLCRRLELFAVPNARSSHALPTPSLGGVAIVLVVLSYLLLQLPAGIDAVSGLIVAGALLALVGLWDDLRELPSLLRLAVHVVAALAVLLTLAADWPPLLLALATVLLVWQINLFNFMDGIDGIAGAQVMVFCVGVMVLSGGIPGWLGELNLLLIGATLGFLAFNWPPARIFMGDVGSGFLGLVLGFLVLALDRQGSVPFVGGLILLTGFWFDASYTLCVRIVTGQRFLSAHRSHLYQKLAQRYGHGRTTGLFALYGVLWLLPLAVLARELPAWSLLWLTLAVVPLAVPAVRWRAGLPAARIS